MTRKEREADQLRLPECARGLCQNCGGTKKDHRRVIGKGLCCRGSRGEMHFQLWTAAEYERACRVGSSFR
jgi:hypothetical protein